MKRFDLGFARLLRDYRQKAKVSQSFLGMASGVSGRTIMRIEAKETEPTWRQVVVLSYLLGIPPNKLFPNMPRGMEPLTTNRGRAIAASFGIEDDPTILGSEEEMS
jgi:transcriptional regulator with XRE-family HTH domain